MKGPVKDCRADEGKWEQVQRWPGQSGDGVGRCRITLKGPGESGNVAGEETPLLSLSLSAVVDYWNLTRLLKIALCIFLNSYK